MVSRFAGLWRNPNFLRLWAGESVSLIGSRITDLALPLTATLVLHASSIQMGLLGAAGGLPWLLFGLVAGAWADRLPRRRIMLATDLGRAVFLGSIPIVASRGWLRLEHLYVVAFAAGVLTPARVPRPRGKSPGRLLGQRPRPPLHYEVARRTPPRAA